MHIEESLTAKGFTPAASVPQVYGGPRVVDGIIIHWWGAYGQTHDGVVNFFVNGPGNTSAHYVVSDGRIHCLVSPWDAAWHAGNGEGNRTKIGIELRPEATDGDYATAAWLIAHLRAQFAHPLPLSPHRQWQATQCPGTYDLGRLDALAKGGAAPAPAPAPVVPQAAPVAAEGRPEQCIVDPGDSLSSIARQYDIPLSALLVANPGVSELIHPGQVLNLPPEQCIVDPGDSLTAIANQFGFSVDRIIARNPGIDPNLIHPGQVLNL